MSYSEYNLCFSGVFFFLVKFTVTSHVLFMTVMIQLQTSLLSDHNQKFKVHVPHNN